MPALAATKATVPGSWESTASTLTLYFRPQKMTSANKALQQTWQEKMQRKAEMKQLRDRLKVFREKKQQKKKDDKLARK